MDNGCKKALHVWPRQIGKDTGDFAYMAKEAARVPGNYFYIFPTKEMARRALWEKVLDNGQRLLGILPEQIVKRRSNQEMVLELNNGSTVRFLGVDKDSDSIRGITPTGVVFSEFAYMDVETYKAVLPAIDKNGAWQIINSTPNGKNHFYLMHLFAQEKKRGWYYSFLQCLDPKKEGFIKVFEPEYFEGLVTQGVMEQADIEREFGCNFETGAKGAYYADCIKQAYIDERIGDFAIDPHYPVETFWDIGYNDDTCIWFRQKIGNRLVFVDYYENNGQKIEFYAEVLKNKGYNYGIHYMPHDAGAATTGRSTVEMFEQACRMYDVPTRTDIIPKPHSVLEGINRVRSRFPLYYFDKTKCHEGLIKIELYHKEWDKKNQVYRPKPAHDKNSHAADALRMEAESEDLFAMDQESTITALRDYDPWA
jgi:hypothetical protein